MAIAENKVVKLHYKGTFSDGTVFDSSEGREPLSFIFGQGMVVPGLEKGIEGLNEGDKKTVEVSVDEGYGERMDDAVQDVPKEQFPSDLDIHEGQQLVAQGPQGPIMVTVKEIKDESVLVDFNHPLAGKDLVFDVEVVEVRDASNEELEHGHVHPDEGEHPDDVEQEESQAEDQTSEEDSGKSS